MYFFIRNSLSPEQPPITTATVRGVRSALAR